MEEGTLVSIFAVTVNVAASILNYVNKYYAWAMASMFMAGLCFGSILGKIIVNLNS